MQITLLPDYILADPEVTAMLQAFYSRSAMPIRERLEELGDNLEKIKEALAKYYIGYNHDSIGDCGNAVVFFEGCSMVFTKAVQDHPLFNGQETSTRFITFTASGLVCPEFYDVNPSVAKEVQESWMAFYETHLPTIIAKLHEHFPHDESSSITKTQWNASVNARAFDIMRTFLPAGTTTQFSFFGSLRTLRDALSSLLFHASSEVRREASAALNILSAEYPSAFSAPKYSETQAEYIASNGFAIHQNFTSVLLALSSYPEVAGSLSTTIDWTEQRLTSLRWASIQTKGPIITENYFKLRDCEKSVLNTRPKGVKVPYHYGRFANFNVDFLLDFGSYRDIQRHRNCKNPLPLLTNRFGIHPWYLDQLAALDSTICSAAYDLIETNYNKLLGEEVLTYNDLVALQYVHPMGMMVAVEMNLALDEMFYISELRSSKTVHPTLRPIAQAMARTLAEYDLEVYWDNSEDGFVPYRGKQDIIKKA
jgi:thymidylate synthase ThyX